MLSCVITVSHFQRIICKGQHFGVLQIKDINTEATAEIVVKRKIKRSVSDGSTFSSLMMGPEEEEESADSHLELYLMNLNRRTKFISHLFRNSCYSRRKTKAKCLTIESTDLFAGECTVLICCYFAFKFILNIHSTL